MPATVRILIVEDNPDDAALVEREVRRANMTCTFRRVDTREGMVAAVREFTPDVILTDHSLPTFSARDALQVAQQLSPGTPVIVVTGRLGDEPAVQYLQLGAADYVVKDHLHRLGPAVLRALDIKRSREAQARAHQLQAATYRIAQAAISTPGLEDLLPVVHQIVGELMPAHNFYIALYDPVQDLLSFPYAVDERDQDFQSKKLGKGLTEYVLRTGQPLLVTPELQAELERRGQVELIGAPSIDWLGVPLQTGDRTIGVLAVQTYSPGVRYGEREKEILEFVSTQVAMAVERSRAEVEVRASEARLKAIIDAALDAVITMDGDGVIRSWSPQAERAFGWPASQVVGRKLSSTIIPPRYREAHERGLAHFLATGAGPFLNQRLEITGVRSDGQEFPVELAITPVRIGGAWLFSAFVRDISERKQAQDALAERTRVAELSAEIGISLTRGRTLQEMLQGCCDALARNLDAAFARVWTLNEAEQMLELQASAGMYTHLDGAHSRVPVGQLKIGLIAAERQPHLTNQVIGDPRVSDQDWARREGMVAFAGYPLMVQDHVVGVMAMFARHPFTQFAGEALAAVADGIAVGIERKRADEALRRSEDRFREMAEHIKEAFFDVDLATGTALYVSPTWAEIWGRPLAEGYDPATWFQAIHPDDRGPMAASQEAVKRGESSTGVFRVVRPDGTIRWVRGRSFPVRDATGRVRRLVGVSEDITEVRATEDQLRQAQKMEAVGRLAGGVAHDFNNLLTAMLGSADLVLETLAPGAPERDDVKEIRKAALRAGELTRQLLAFSRQQVLAPRVLDLNALVTDMEKLLRRLIGEDVELRTALAPDLGAVKADPGQIEQVIANLVVNARDAMPAGGRLTIETANAELDQLYSEQHVPVQPGSYVLLAVSDSGTGMDAQTKSHIFEPFFTTKEKGKGTGLGLATVYGVVKQSGGYIWVYSEPGQGTAFKIYLPRVTETPDATRRRSTPAAPRGGSETVLLVEDDEMVRELTRRMLSKRGYAVLAAADGGAALRQLESHRGSVDLLVTDVVMPGMSGREVAQRLLALRPGLKVLYLSGYTDDAIVRHGMLEPGIAFLQKPFSGDALARKVRDVLDAPASTR